MDESTHARRARNRQAFETCLGVFKENEAGSRMRGSVWAEAGGLSSRNGATPTKSDFQVDFFLCVKRVCKNRKEIDRFFQHFVAEKAFLTRNQEFAMILRVGALLIKRGLFPVGGYYRTIRSVPTKGTTAQIGRAVGTADLPEGVAGVQEAGEPHEKPTITTTDDSAEQAIIHDLITTAVEIDLIDTSDFDLPIPQIPYYRAVSQALS